MTKEQKRGRAYMLVAILTVLILDIAVNALSLVASEFVWTDVVRVLLTFLLCWFVWRGSRIGYILCCSVWCSGLCMQRSLLLRCPFSSRGCPSA
jgi:hypothetical protein